MRHPQRVGERLELGDVPVQQRRRQRADVERQAQDADEDGEEDIKARDRE